MVTQFFGFPAKSSYRDKYENFSKDIPVSEQNFNVLSDEKRIKQVLMNLQSNALKFTKDNGTITIICEYIRGIYTD